VLASVRAGGAWLERWLSGGFEALEQPVPLTGL
jgi:hypothetical protein